MKKEHLTVDQVTEALKKTFDKHIVSCIDFSENITQYHIKTETGEILVTPKRIWRRIYGEPVIQNDHPMVLNIRGELYAPFTPEKELREKLLICCGFKKQKGPDEAKPIWQRIKEWEQNITIYMRRLKESEAKHIATDINRFVKFTETLYTDFTSVTVTYTETELFWRYYTGTAKNFREGKAKRILAPVDHDFLIPELQALAAKYGRKIIRNITTQMVA